MRTVTIQDDQWAKILAFLYACPRAYVSSEAKCRRFVEGVLWVLRSPVQVAIAQTEIEHFALSQSGMREQVEPGAIEAVFRAVSVCFCLNNLLQSLVFSRGQVARQMLAGRRCLDAQDSFMGDFHRKDIRRRRCQICHANRHQSFDTVHNLDKAAGNKILLVLDVEERKGLLVQRMAWIDDSH